MKWHNGLGLIGLGLVAIVLGNAIDAARGQATAPTATAPAPPLLLGPGMTKTLLDKITLSTIAEAPDKDAGPTVPLVFPDVAVGLHINAQHYAVGDPVPAYFVVKNPQTVTRGVDLRPEFFRDLSRAARTMKVELRRTDGGALNLKSHGSVPRILEDMQFAIPSRGYICFSGDVRTLAEDNTLPAGAYAACWTYAGIKTAEAPFVIAPEAASQPAVAATALATATMPAGIAVLPDRVDVLDLIGSTTKRRRGDAVLDWTNSMLNRTGGSQLGCALAAGIDGRYYPDMFNLPTRDEFLALSAEFIPGVKDAPDNNETNPRKDKTLDHIVVKIAPVAGPGVTLPRILLGAGNTTINLLVESVGRSRAVGNSFDGDQVDELAMESWSMEKGGTINITLRRDWRNTLTFAGKARLAVVILSEHPWAAFQGEGQETGPTPVKASKYWKGALRTEYVLMDVKR